MLATDIMSLITSKPTRQLAPNICTVQDGIKKTYQNQTVGWNAKASSCHDSILDENSRLREKFDVRQGHDAVRQITQILVCCKRSAARMITRALVM